jgi:hypothetical protein
MLSEEVQSVEMVSAGRATLSDRQNADLPKVNAATGQVEQVQHPETQHSKHHCHRFMERGNKPVPLTFEMKDANEQVEGSPDQRALVPALGLDGFSVLHPQAQDIALLPATGESLGGESKKQVVYGDLKLGKFEEEVGGINLAKLFSVYGPQSAQGKRKKKPAALPRHFDSTAQKQLAPQVLPAMGQERVPAKTAPSLVVLSSKGPQSPAEKITNANICSLDEGRRAA